MTAHVLITEHDSLYQLVKFTIAYFVIFVTGMLGNSATCIIILRNRSMRTATNHYIVALSATTMAVLISRLPLEAYRLWAPYTYPLTEEMCIAIGFLCEVSEVATILTIVAISVESYIAIYRSFISHTSSQQSRAVHYICAIWVYALCTAVPQAMQLRMVTKDENGQNATMCTVKENGVHQVFVIITFLFFLMMMFISLKTYAVILYKLRPSHQLNPPNGLSVETNDRSNRTARYKASQRNVITMLALVALSFFVCWTPFHVQRLLAIYGFNLEKLGPKFSEVYVCTHILGVLYFMPAAITPVLYIMMWNKFWNAFKMTFSSCYTGPRANPSGTEMLELPRARHVDYAQAECLASLYESPTRASTRFQ